MGPIFISYSHKDATYAHKLQQHLLEQGFEAWIDDRIDYGTEWPQEIKKRLKECAGFILVMSPSAEESFWVQNELNLALNLKKPIFPLLLEGETWWNLGTIQFVNVTGGMLPDTKFYGRLAEVAPPKIPGLPPLVKDKKSATLRLIKPELLVAIIGLAGMLCATLIALLLRIYWLPTSFTPTTYFTLTAPAPTSSPDLFTQPHTPSLTLTTEITDTQGVTMRLVPAGSFTMGSDNGGADERPVHKVTLADYYMDVYEVTYSRYKACIDAGDCTPPQGTFQQNTDEYDNSSYAKYPIAHVDWNQAKAYCEWRGARLPTEAEWEKAARGTDGRTYPWGEGIDKTIADYNNNVGNTTPVGSYENGKSPYGMYDMAGNVWEWVSSLYQPYPYNASDGREDLSALGNRVLRGGSWGNDNRNVRSAYRYWYLPMFRNSLIGFRCARTP
jgi:formylglycine-generating enzyme required for sulfatase activity